MIELGISRPPRRPEIRTDATSLAISLLTAAVGATAAQTWAAGAVEVAAGIWARTLSTAAVDGAPVGPRWLAETGRALARTAGRLPARRGHSGPRAAATGHDNGRVGRRPRSGGLVVSTDRHGAALHEHRHGAGRLSGSYPLRDRSAQSGPRCLAVAVRRVDRHLDGEP